MCSVFMRLSAKMFKGKREVLKQNGVESFPKRQILDSSKPKEFADDSVRFDKMLESSLKG